jgi:hypothetical protein
MLPLPIIERMLARVVVLNTMMVIGYASLRCFNPKVQNDIVHLR